MMDVAERYLGELAERCMVQVEFKEKDEYSTITESKRFKSCRLHGLMLDLCILKVREESFFKTIDYRGIHNQEVHPSFSSLATSTDASNSNKIRRLAIYLDENSDLPLFDLKQEEIARPIRAILFFICSYINYPFGEQLIHLCKNSKCLRVIHFHRNESGDFTDGKPKELPKEIGNLIFLRYLGLKDTGFTKLPSSVGNLKYLQTLDLRTTDEISVPNVLWKMESLVHLYLPYYHLFSTEGKLRVDGLSNLETLENFAPDKVDVKGLFELTNLRRLGEVRIQGKQKNLPEVVNYLLNSKKLQHTSIFIVQCDFCSDEELSLLRQLFSCDCLVGLTIIGIIDRLPEYNRNFYRSLASLTLSGSQLKEDPIATLEQMPNLRILVLVNAFAGKNHLVFSAYGFPQLERLRLHSLEIGEWMIEEGAMPTLSFLSIGSCKNLMMLPDGLRFITTLQELDITEMPEAFKDRLQMVNDKEGEDLHKCHIPSVRFS
ncbi:putative disease resistance protein [Camellia lanceoleosa]|uniref:Disease resistance protein n=1 Tax=Camellia lanceoleosa TaxID=1840588 RepID=A0ACC0HEG5_9ERIC|nr:putative disease resistance protein [Camellia lanceoleosa]